MDCGQPETSWGGPTYGILLCVKCAGRHRSLGTHLTVIKSVRGREREKREREREREKEKGEKESKIEGKREKERRKEREIPLLYVATIDSTGTYP